MARARVTFLSLVSMLLLGALGCGSSSAAGQSRPTDAGTRGREVLATSGSGTGSTQAGGPGWIGGAAAQDQVLLGSTGELPIGVWMDIPRDAAGRPVRPPLAISLVIDTSGSMEGAKIRSARSAAVAFLETLRDGDLVALYAFSSNVRVLAYPTILNANIRTQMIRSVQSLEANGSTAMYGGIEKGSEAVARAPSGYPIRRVVVVSDGQANVGPSDVGSFGRLAANGTEYGVQVTAIGIGLDYDEHTLGVLATQSSGRMYHLQESAQLASILESELGLLSNTIATAAYIEIVPAPGVEFVGVDSQGAVLVNGRIRADLGTVFAGQRREVLLRARVSSAVEGPHGLASVRLAYRTPDGTEAAEQRADLAYGVTRDAATAGASRDVRVAGMVAQERASQAQIQAAQLLARGEGERAADVLQAADRDLAVVAASAPAASPTRARLEERSRQVRSLGTRARASSRAGAAAPAAARATLLDAYDMAMEASGY